MIGGGGGASVLAADQCEEEGLEVIPLPTEVREALKNKGIPIWDWVGNPTDISILSAGKGFTDTDMLQIMARNHNFDLLIANVNYVAILAFAKKEDTMSRIEDGVKGYIKVMKENSKPLLTVVAEESLSINDDDDWIRKFVSAIKTKLIAANIPFYPTIGRAARAARKLIDYYQRREFFY